MEPALTNPRLVAQSGKFTIHYNAQPLQAWYESTRPTSPTLLGPPASWLACFQVNHREIVRELRSLGTKASTLFPAVESLAKEIDGTPTSADIFDALPK